MYQALYRKYRPKTFDDVVGQDVIIKTLKNSIDNNKITHAYLFTGPRGTGKTSIAKILAQMVNCESLNNYTPCNKCVSCTQTSDKQNTDIIEIDAASNNGVDEIRDLRDKVNLVPSYGKYKIYIIDEVHMLTTAAFNALLKTLEEPPKHIIFILATTEPHKIPLTILSRCQRFDFKKIGINDIKKRLTYICDKEKILIDEKALELVSNLCDGGMRDSVGLLDQLSAYTLDKITVDDVNEVFGTITEDKISELLTNIINKNLKNTFELILKYDDQGKNLIKIIELLIVFLKNCLIYSNDSSFIQNESKKILYENLCNELDENKIYSIIEIFLDSIRLSKENNNTKLIFELAIIRVEQLLNKKEKTKEKIISQEIYENSKKTINKENKVVNRQITNEIKQKLQLLKKIRVQNTLSMFDKKELLEFKKKLDKIKEKLMDPDYSSIVSVILDGELKAKGNTNLIFVYKIEKLSEYFNISLPEIEIIFSDCFGGKYYPIAVTEEEWELIKKEFNKNIKLKNSIYKYIEEKEGSIDFLKSTKIVNSNEQSANDIEKMFDNIIIYN